MKILKKFKLWSTKKPVLASVLSMVAISIPFIAGIIGTSYLIENQIVHAVVAGVFLVGDIVTYVFFTKYMNKL